MLLRELIPHLDIIVENFRPGYLDRLGFSFAELQEINPRVILVSISGYGKDGPYANQTAFCNVALAASGYLAVSGEPTSQVHHTGVSIADRLAGVHGAIGALAALAGRERTGRGEHVDVSLMDAALTMIEFPLATLLMTGRRPPTDAEGRRAGSSPNHVFQAGDGLILINAPKQDQWERLLGAMGREDLVNDARFDSPLKRQTVRRANRDRGADSGVGWKNVPVEEAYGRSSPPMSRPRPSATSNRWPPTRRFVIGR